MCINIRILRLYVLKINKYTTILAIMVHVMYVFVCINNNIYMCMYVYTRDL
jgi:hypothetical protein